MRIKDAALVVGATARLTRLVVVDDLGTWVLAEPARAWAARAEPAADGWRTKLVSGLDCPWCVGFWIGAAVLLLPRRRRVVRWALSALALNYTVATTDAVLDRARSGPPAQG